MLLVWHSYVGGENKMLSPQEYGLSNCVSDIQRYYVLQEIHNDAVKMGCGVDYSGIDSINIEIPYNAKPMPLSDYTDFGGVVLNVRNQTKNATLFRMKQPMTPMNVTLDQIENGNIIDKYQDYIIVIEDQKLWVEKRRGHSYGHTRKDILLVKDGKIKNKVVASYETACSKPIFFRCDVNKSIKVIKNLIVNRDTASTYKTNILFMENQNDVEIDNITINTPSPGKLYGDAAINIKNCTNVKIKDVTINGTYSQNNKSGYGISMNNVWNVSFDHLTGHGNWGIFGNNNVNTATLVNCDINRFDIHCYGKDVTFKNCTFRDLYNQFSSVYGKVLFDNCQFIDFLPVLFESSYNAYTGFDLSFKDCTWQMKQGHNYLIQAGNPYGGENERIELKEKCWPNLMIENMKIVAPDNISEIYLFECKALLNSNVKLGYIHNVRINNMKVVNCKKHQMNTKIFMSNKPVVPKKRLTTNVLMKKK